MRSGLANFSASMEALPGCESLSGNNFQHPGQVLWKSLCGLPCPCSVRWHTHPDIALPGFASAPVFCIKGKKSTASSQSPKHYSCTTTALPLQLAAGTAVINPIGRGPNRWRNEEPLVSRFLPYWPAHAAAWRAGTGKRRWNSCVLTDDAVR